MSDPTRRESSPAGTLVPPKRSRSTAQQIEYFYKPAIFLLCLLPVLVLAGRAFGVMGGNLGANPVETVLHTLGKWGLKFIVLTLAVTPLKDIFNFPRLLMFRRMLGLFAFFYVLLHFLTWLVLDQGLFWPGILVDIGKRPYITIGFAALLMLVPLAVTSTNKMMRRLGRRWTKLHRLIYVIAVLGVWHYFWQVKKDVREPLLYFGVVVALLAWRVWRRRGASKGRLATAA
jgi:sulfoxide reductase heme-binding subunit YedZ